MKHSLICSRPIHIGDYFAIDDGVAGAAEMRFDDEIINNAVAVAEEAFDEKG